MVTTAKGSVVVIRELLNVVSIKDLGPEGTDISTSVTSALLLGYPIFIPAGTWIISQLTLPDNSIIYGVGDKSILKVKDAANNSAISLGKNCKLFSFMIDGNKNAQAGGGFHGVYFNNANNCIVDSVNVKNTKGSGFLFDNNCSNVVIRNSVVTGHTESGIRINSANNILLDKIQIIDPDLTSSGDGINLMSDGTVVESINIQSPVIRNSINRGISIIGNGSRNVRDIIINSPIIAASQSHNIHIVSAEAVMVTNGINKQSAADGVRIEGDVINCRVSMVAVKGNAGTGIREIVSGASPDFNGLIYNIVTGNGSNLVTKVGNNSFVV